MKTNHPDQDRRPQTPDSNVGFDVEGLEPEPAVAKGLPTPASRDGQQLEPLRPVGDDE